MSKENAVSSTTVVMDVEAQRERTPGIPLAPLLGVVGVWMGLSWLAIGLALHPVLPGGWATVAMLFLLSALPLWPLSLGLSGRIYPGAALRLFVQRPFWYLFLALPLLALASTIGAVIGLPFGTSAVLARLLSPRPPCCLPRRRLPGTSAPVAW